MTLPALLAQMLMKLHFISCNCLFLNDIWGMIDGKNMEPYYFTPLLREWIKSNMFVAKSQALLGGNIFTVKAIQRDI